MDRAHGALWGRLGRAPEACELGHELNLGEQDVEELATIGRTPVSLDAPLSREHDRTLGETLAIPDPPDPLEAIDRERAWEASRRRLSRLPARERQVLRWRFGLGGEEDRTLAEIGRQLELSRERVRQIAAEALAKLGEPEGRFADALQEEGSSWRG